MATKSIIQSPYTLLLPPVSALFVAGYGLAFSQATVNHIANLPPQTSTPLFKRIFHSGGETAVPLTLISSAVSGLLWYLHDGPVEQERLFAMAGLSVVATLPYTGWRMFPGIRRLLEISESEKLQLKTEQTLEARQLIKKWVRQNSVRTALYLFGAAAGFNAALLG